MDSKPKKQEKMGAELDQAQHPLLYCLLVAHSLGWLCSTVETQSMRVCNSVVCESGFMSCVIVTSGLT